MSNQLILGDNLEVLKTFPSESVDLIYIDPPFFSNREYKSCCNVAFSDKWAGGINHYIGWLYERVEELYRVLKPTGSFYLHCDWHANAYIRVNILDKIFGDKNFVNEIVWCYRQVGRANNRFGNKHDTIYFFAKSGGNNRIFNADLVRVPYEGTGGYQTSGRGVTINGRTYKPNDLGKIPEDWWDIPAITPMSKERIGYPTQKPEALLERIIKASSNEGDIVLDAFCGGGTTCAVARRLGRKFIGIDQSVRAIELTNIRLNGFNYDLVVYNSDRSSYV